MKSRRNRHYDRLDSLERDLDQLRHDALYNWTPGQALGSIRSHLDRWDDGVCATEEQLHWLKTVLGRSIDRAAAGGLDPVPLRAVQVLLDRCCDHHVDQVSTKSGQTKAMHDLIRIEIAYLDTSLK